ncbi:MAG TPA: hypothetical protein VMX13_04810 [Sedimentisphaerales bacterium]|nr:hypothetical protein [Sedimentisphaerales bacterium]
MILIDMGFMVVFYPTYIILNKMRNKANIKDFNKALFGACPEWLSIITGFFIIYGLVWLTFFVFKRYFGSSVTTKWQGIVANSGIVMAFYCLVFTLLYSCRRLRRDMLFERNQPIARD